MPDGGAVEVRTSTDGTVGEFHIEIVGTGRGISPQRAGNVLRPQQRRVARSTEADREQQGSPISFIPDPSQGTNFRIRFPCAAAE